MRRFLLSLALLPLVTGCGITIAPHSTDTAAQVGVSIQGILQGGHQAIPGSHIHLLATSTAGYGAASTSLLTSGTAGTDSLGGYVTTAEDGTFSIAGDVPCTPGQQLYLLGTGGNSVAQPNGPSNPAIALMATLGACPATGSVGATAVTLNEVSTVATAFALSGFATDATHIGISGTPASQVGLQNAFANVGNLVDRASGTALATTPAGNGTAPQATVDTLANILAACVDTNGTTPPTCSTLFANATADGTSSGTRPTETATAAINIAHHPAANVAALYALSISGLPFTGALSAPPADLTLTLQFATNTVGATVLAVDAAGDVWFPSASSLGAISPLGVPLYGSPYVDPSIQAPQSIVIDASDNIWLPNYTGNAYTHFNALARTFSSAAVAGFNYPTSITIDPAGDLWFANHDGNSLTKLNPDGSPMVTLASNGLNQPFETLSDASGNIWTPNPNSGNIVVTPVTGPSRSVTAPGLSPAFGVQLAAFDSHQNLWVANQDGSISGVTQSGAAISGTPFNTGTGTTALSLSVDGLSNLWTLVSSIDPNSAFGSKIFTLLGYNATGTSLLGSTHTFPAATTSLAVDGSGNLWVGTYNSGAVYQIVGLTTPVVTPVSVGVAHNTIATRP